MVMCEGEGSHDRRHEEVVYDSGECPVCEVMEKLGAADNQRAKAIKLIDALKEDVIKCLTDMRAEIEQLDLEG